MILKPYEKYHRPKDIMLNDCLGIIFDLTTNYIKKEFYFGYTSLYFKNEIVVRKNAWKLYL
jgi:hypothetical protein